MSTFSVLFVLKLLHKRSIRLLLTAQVKSTPGKQLWSWPVPHQWKTTIPVKNARESPVVEHWLQSGDWKGSLPGEHFPVLSSALIGIFHPLYWETLDTVWPIWLSNDSSGTFWWRACQTCQISDPQVACPLPPRGVLFAGRFCLFWFLPSAPLQDDSSESFLFMILTPRAVALGVLFLSELLFWQHIYYQCCDISPLAF